jgi:transposase
MIKHSEEFRQEAVRIALTSGLPRARVASDLGVGKSALGMWVSEYRPTDLVSAPQADLAREKERSVTELIWRQSWPTRRQAEAAIF